MRDLPQGSLAALDPEKVRTLIVLRTALREPVPPGGKSLGGREEDEKKEEEEVRVVGQVS